MKISEIIKNLQNIKNEHGDIECYCLKDDDWFFYENVLCSNISMRIKDKYGEFYGSLSLKDIEQMCINDGEIFDINQYEKVCLIN